MGGATKQRPAVIKRFPRLRYNPESSPLVKPAERHAFPGLAEDFAFLDRELMPAFAELDVAALREQNRYRRQQIILIAGALLVTVFGAVQAWLRGQAWPGIFVGVLSLAMSAVTATGRQRDTQGTYLSARVKAERLRGLYFTYLAGSVADGDSETRRKALIASVAAVKHGREPK
jgi:Protein of unknown function (DUF4231)